MSQALYRKYRSKSLDELVGQDHIVNALRASVKSGKISHAYLFTGPRGTGKTSVARILAHDLNGIKYDESATDIDIIEIDAASNRRIDEIRDLREKVQIAPTSLKYKVYIIDEVHMLTKEAFNALLKTLEEPPEHAIFILATTELHKVPDTIISRTQRYAFKPIEQSKIVGHLKTIATSEKIDFDDDALELIAEHADGGFRDAIGLLDQVRHTSTKVTSQSVMDALGVPPNHSINLLWESLQSKNQTSAKELKDLYEAGYHAPMIAKALLQKAITASNVSLARELLAVSASFDPKTELLLITLKDTKPTESPVEAPKPAKAEVQPKLKVPVAPPPPEIKEPVVATTPVEVPTPITHESATLWEEILASIKASGHSVYGPLRLAKAQINETELKLGLAFPFHIKRINDQKNLDIINKAIIDTTGKERTIVVERLENDASEKPPTKPPQATPSETLPVITEDPDIALMTDPLSIVKNVFGGAEVL